MEMMADTSNRPDNSLVQLHLILVKVSDMFPMVQDLFCLDIAAYCLCYVDPKYLPEVIPPLNSIRKNVTS